jgi:N-acetylneuraminic acid mutarotase
MPTANLLIDGRVLVAGGAVSETITVASADLYDPTTRTFSTAGSMSVARVAAASARLLDGRILVVGGQGADYIAVASVEIYNPSRDTWSFTGTMSTPRVNSTATLLNNGKVLVVGGYSIDDNSFPLASAELYDPTTGTFLLTGSLSTGRRNQTATLLNNGKVLIAGGYNGTTVDAPEIYDPTTGTFSVTGC